MSKVIHEVINTPFQVAMDCTHTPDESDHICWQCTVKIIDMAEAAEARAAQLQAERDTLATELERVKAERDAARKFITSLLSYCDDDGALDDGVFVNVASAKKAAGIEP